MAGTFTLSLVSKVAAAGHFPSWQELANTTGSNIHTQTHRVHNNTLLPASFITT